MKNQSASNCAYSTKDFPHNPLLRSIEGKLHLERLEKVGTPDSAQSLKSRLRQMLDRRHLSDLLLEVQHWTNFLSGFTRLNSGRLITEEDIGEQIKLLTCLIAEGCNIGFSDMSIIGPGLSDEQFYEIQANFIRPETLQRATARMVNFHLRQWLPAAMRESSPHTSSVASD